MKVYKCEIQKCSDCPNMWTESYTLGIDGYLHNCKVNHIEYNCMAIDRSLGNIDWVDGKWESTFKDKIPKWCPLNDK